MEHSSYCIGVIGLGYVGLPLAVEFAKYYPVVGFDINRKRIGELQQGLDMTLEVDTPLMNQVIATSTPVDGANGLYCTYDVADLGKCNVFIITVPTPVDKNNRPDLTPLYKASETVGKALKKGDIVVYESTVYPGVTEDECVPVLEKVSGLVFNKDFYCGYSPERINPGDKLHTVSKIKKITSGSTPEIAEVVDALYRTVITAGTHKAASIKVAEAAKVIENSQRDINIAFVNELAMIFNRMGIDTHQVLEASATKWNFLPFKPGLVGGHCIGVDPYYLAQKAQEVGYHPEIILAGRRLNDGMGKYIAGEVVKLMIKKDITIKAADAWRFTKKNKPEFQSEDDDERDDTLTQQQPSLSAPGAVGGSSVRMTSSAGASDNVGAGVVTALQSTDASVDGTGRFDMLRSLSSLNDSAEEMDGTVISQDGH